MMCSLNGGVWCNRQRPLTSKMQSKLSILKQIFLVAVTIPAVTFCQILQQTPVNTLSTTLGIQHKSQLALVSPDTICIVYKRGSGVSAADNQIIAAVSRDGGKSFSEVDISANRPSLATGQSDNPRVAATNRCIITAYQNKNNYLVDGVVIARSTDGGNTFSEQKYYPKKIADPFAGIFCSDGVSRFVAYAYGRASISADTGKTFDTLPVLPLPTAVIKSVAITPGHLWVAAKANSTLLYLYHSTNDGQNYTHAATISAPFPQSANFASSATGDSLWIAYVNEEVGVFTLYWKLFKGTALLDSGSVLNGNSDPADNGIFADIHQNPWQIATGINDENLYLAASNNAVWYGPYKVNAGYDAPQAGAYHKAGDLFYACGNGLKTSVTGTAPVWCWKWIPTNVPAVRMLTHELLLPSRDTEKIWLEIISFVNAKTRLQVSADSNFASLAIDTLLSGVELGVSPNRLGVAPLQNKPFYVRGRSEKTGEVSDWSSTLRINFSDKTSIKSNKKLPQGLVPTIKYNAGFLSVTGIASEALQSVSVMQLNGRLVRYATVKGKCCGYAIGRLEPGIYIVRLNGFGNKIDKTISIVR